MKTINFLNGKGRFDSESLAGKKKLFATFPADGHFNPLTGLAAHLVSLNCDVRWYTAEKYSGKIESLGAHFYGYKYAVDVSDLEKTFPERNAIKGTINKLKFDMTEIFIMRGPEYYRDIVEIQAEFDFEFVVADCAFSAIPFITDKINVPVITIGVMPLFESSKDLAPSGLGITPSSGLLGNIKMATLRMLANTFLFRDTDKVMRRLMDKHGIDHADCGLFDLLIRKSSIFLQSGTPGFEYYRSDLSRNIRFIGPLLPHNSKKQRNPWFDKRLAEYDRIILVTQGTIERDVEKLLVPTLEAFSNSDVLVVCTTGGSATCELRERFPAKNIIIEDFIPFADVMPFADIYITNGGYGGVTLAVEHKLPLLAAGIHEGKNEINARIGYFDLGIDLGTEKPKPAQIRKAISKLFMDDKYQIAVARLAREFGQYKPAELFTHYLQETIQTSTHLVYPKMASGF
jgi:MGT family glycosyltransferase